MISRTPYRRTVAVKTLTVLLLLAAGLTAGAQSLSVLPVNVFLPTGQNAATLTVTNHGDHETAIQIRPYAWNQPDGNDQLDATRALVISPPIATIPPGGSQVVRLILRQPPQDRESTYRIIVDQIPPPAEPGVVHVVLRLSIPIFAQPSSRAVPHLQFHLEADGGQLHLVALNDGLRHESVREIELSTSDGRKLKPDTGASPYVLAGATHRWHFAVTGSLPLPGDTLRLSAHADSGSIEEQVRVVAKQ